MCKNFCSYSEINKLTSVLLCVCPVFDHEFRHNIVKVAVDPQTRVRLCTSQFQNRPPPSPRAIPGHLTRVKLRTVGNLTQKEARPVGHFTFLSKRLSAVGSKRISQFFASAREPRSWVIHVHSTWVCSVVVVLYSYIVRDVFI